MARATLLFLFEEGYSLQALVNADKQVDKLGDCQQHQGIYGRQDEAPQQDAHFGGHGSGGNADNDGDDNAGCDHQPGQLV